MFFFFFYPRKVGEGKKVEYSLNWHYANLWGVRQNENLFINNYSHLFIYKMEYGFDERKERKYIICISSEIERMYEKEKLTRLEKIWIIYAYEYWFLVHSIFSSPFSYFAICTNWINPYFADGGHFKRTFLFISMRCRMPIKGHRNEPNKFEKEKKKWYICAATATDKKSSFLVFDSSWLRKSV